MNITIVAEKVSRFRILDELHRKHGIEVRAQNLADEKVSLHVVDVPLLNVLDRLLPEGSRYVVRFGARELEIPIKQTGDKRGEADVRAAVLPTKDKTRKRLPSELRDLKVPVNQWKETPPRAAPNIKPKAATVIEVPRGKGPKEMRVAAVTEQTVRLSFRIVAPSQIDLIDVQTVPGAMLQGSFVRGPFLFVLRTIVGDLTYFGALPDPLELHSYNTDGTHSVGRAKEGAFGIWLPMRLASSNRLVDATLEFYDASGVALPPSLDEKSIRRVLEEAKLVAKISGEQLAKAISRSLEK